MRIISLDEWENILWPRVFKPRLPAYLRTKEHSMKLFYQLKEAESEQARKESNARRGTRKSPSAPDDSTL